jgi:PAS domain S-box-containing protein
MRGVSERGQSEPVREGGGNARAEDLCARILTSVRDTAILALDTDGRIVLWNRGAQEITGYEESEALGQSYSLFGSHENEADVVRLLQSAQDQGSFHQERWWRRRDGGLVWVEEMISPLDGTGFVVISRDLTDRVELEERRLAAGRAWDEAGVSRERLLHSELQAAERRASFLAEASSILVATSLDFDSTLKALARLAVSRLADWCVIHAQGPTGELEPAEVAHRNPELETALEEAADWSEGWHRVATSVRRTGQAELLDRVDLRSWFEHGRDVPLAGSEAASAMVTPLLGRGAVLGTVTLVSAEPHRAYTEEDLALAEELGRRAAIALDNARLYREAQQANRAKADFLAIISHELRTPLNAIMGYSDLLDAGISGSLTDRQLRQVDRIRASARHLLQLIEEILSYARMEAGGEELRLEAVNARDIARDAAIVIEPLAHSRDLELRLDVDGPQIMMQTDASKVRQVLVNLLSNAVKFTERGYVELRVSAHDGHVVYEVADTGVGIPASEMSRIFDPFWQAERPNTRRAGGTGLGLSVSRRYVRLLRGDIKVESEPGRGTRVRVTLPVRTPVHGPDSRSAARGSTSRR